MPGVYLLECRPVNSEEDWTGLDLQLVVSENSRISISGYFTLACSIRDFASNCSMNILYSSLLPMMRLFCTGLRRLRNQIQFLTRCIFKPYRVKLQLLGESLVVNTKSRKSEHF